MSSTRRNRGTLVTLVTVLLAAGACDDATGPEDVTTRTVAVQFGTRTTASASTASWTESGPMSNHTSAELVVEGGNGTLTIEDVRLIVAEFELDRAGDDCEGPGENDACEKFEAPPAFVDLPLAGGSTPAVEQAVPADEYEELEFEIEDLDDDEEDPVLRQQIEELRDTILAEFPDWPDEASVLVTGRFTPTDGEPTSFRAYFEAEIEIEREFQPPLLITSDATDPSVTVTVDPAMWFRMPDGNVLDLTAYDYDTTGEVHEFELEFEDGFVELEWDD